MVTFKVIRMRVWGVGCEVEGRQVADRGVKEVLSVFPLHRQLLLHPGQILAPPQELGCGPPKHQRYLPRKIGNLLPATNSAAHALRFVLHTVPHIGRSYQLFPDGFDLLPPPPKHPGVRLEPPPRRRNVDRRDINTTFSGRRFTSSFRWTSWVGSVRATTRSPRLAARTSAQPEKTCVSE